MAEEMESMVFLEDMFTQAGFEDGERDAKLKSFEQGLELGILKGFEFHIQMGYYRGLTEYYLEFLEKEPNEKIRKILESMIFLTENVDLSSPDYEPSKAIQSLSSKTKQLFSILKLKLTLYAKQNLSF